MGIERTEALTMLLLTLPGVAFTYNGDEIRMEDYREITWDDTTDPWACNAGPEAYEALSRDPQRTPFQWDGSTNAGFNTGGKPWIPVHPNYTETNLAAQENINGSFYNFYKSLLHLRKNETFSEGDFESKVLSEDVFGFTRSTSNTTIVVLINFGGASVSVNLNDLTVKLEKRAEIVLASPSSSHKDG